MNLIWCVMILVGITISFFNGSISQLTTEIIASGKTALSITMTMCSIVAIWSGIMKIAEKSHLVDKLTIMLYPIIKPLFPDIPKNHPSLKHISTNITSNFLGLGWAATPSGISTMKSLSELNNNNPISSNSMIMFMVINMSSVQLIAISVLAYRTQYGAIDPASIIFPGIVATTISTLVGIVSVKIAERCAKK